MKAILYVVALLAIGGAGFFSLQTKTKFENQRDLKLGVMNDNKVMTGKVNDKDKELQDELAALEAATKDKADAEAAVETLKSKENTLRRDIATVTSTLEEQKAKFAELEKVRQQVDEILKGAGVTLESLPEEVVKIEQDRKAKSDKLAELTQLAETASRAVSNNQDEIGRLADRSASRDARIRRNALESVVSATNDEWGFVIINAGSNTGFNPQTKLLIKRDGRLIAEVKPSSVEPSQTVAEIDPDTIAPGARVQPGDRVILATPASN